MKTILLSTDRMNRLVRALDNATRDDECRYIERDNYEVWMGKTWSVRHEMDEDGNRELVIGHPRRDNANKSRLTAYYGHAA